MSPHAPNLMAPSILVVDDEKQIHSSLRLRLGPVHHVVGVFDPREALKLIKQQPFDLCIVDVHMPEMDGLTFIESAREVDPALGYVVLSGYDSDENLRRAIPLQIYEFIPKPLPDQNGFEKRMPEWIDRTLRRRREMALATSSETIAQDLELACIERDVESTASESAREALLQTSSTLTMVQALLLSMSQVVDPIEKKDSKLLAISRNLQEARRRTEDAASIADAYFASAYADREASPAVIDTCLRHAVAIALRRAKADARRQAVDFSPIGEAMSFPALTGIDFLLMMVPALIQSLELAPADTTVHIECGIINRLSDAISDFRWREFMWVNRRNATVSSPGISLCIRTRAVSVGDTELRNWLRGDHQSVLRIPSRGVLGGIQKSKGLLGLSVRGKTEKFELVFVLPV
jgi:CheY-like chemotaxis protein